MTAHLPIFISGLGAVSPIGTGIEAFATALRAGRSGVALLPVGLRTERSSVGARCEEFDPRAVLDDADLARLPRLTPMALAAAREAIARAGLDEIRPSASERTGLILGTGGGGIDFTLAQARAATAGDRPSLWSVTNATHGNLAGELSIRLGLRGPSLCVSTGCASSSDAFGLAMGMLRAQGPNAPDAMVVVGADAHITPEVLRGMELLRVISTRTWRDAQEARAASRPFDAARDGFVLGEGAWAAVLERADSVRRREALGRVVGQALGYGATCDAFHRVRPDPDMAQSIRAMRIAIADAGLRPTDIEVIALHGTGTPVNDHAETRAVRGAFGEHADALRGHAVKSMIGHPQGASGLAAIVATLCGLTGADGGEPFLHPTINLSEPDEACDLDCTPNQARPTRARVALVNCLAFGAKNSAIVVSTPS
ncbi:MAG: beta-ketoacyl-[acyl-carrier-protein] synthase family protein [Phycisphaeraceae bacterium]|nr:beta-ketoacyl-[acyl-carrier-protein] synthase family protein [Phycisphaeraceae bacterium]